MERERRIQAARRWLRRGGGDTDPVPGAEPSSTPAKPLGGEQLSLGALDEGRREAVMTKLRGLRSKPPSRPARPTPGAAADLRAPTARSAGPGPPEAGTPPPPPPKEDRSFGGRVSAAARSARLHVVGAGAAVAHRWRGLPRIAQQRIAAAAIVGVLVALVVWVLIPAAPCGAPGGDSCPAEDHAIALVPDDALAYAHVDIDSGGEQLAAASAYAERLPLLSGLLVGSLSEVGGKPVDLRSQVIPWAGEEAALAVLPQLPSPATVTMIEAEDVDAARDFASGVIGEGSTEDLGGLDVMVGRRGQAAALLDGFLLIGDKAGVERMVEGDLGNLSTAAVAAGIDDLPDDRFAYAYLSGDGARALLGRGSELATLDTFVNSGASSAVTAALSFEGGLASLTIRSEQDPDLAAEQPAFFSALPQFDPSLDADVGPDALAYLGLGDPARSVESLLRRAETGAPALVDAFDRASEDLRRAGGVSIVDDLLPLLGDEAALSVEPVAAEEASPTPGVLEPSGVPYVSLIADGVDSKAAAQSLADLQKPLVDALAPGGGEAAGQVAVFEPLQIAGIEAQSLTVSPNVELTYATYDDRLVAATKPIGIAQARDGGEGLADSEDYRGVTSTMPADVSMLTYLDLRDLLDLGEQVGLAADPAYARLAPDLRSLQAAALAVDDTGGEVRTDISISLGEPEQPDPDAAGLGAE